MILKKVKLNRLKIKSILKTLLFCARQNIALRGHQEVIERQVLQDRDDGNFRVVLRFRVESEDDILKKHFEKAAENAVYLSPKVQNDLLDIAGTLITERIVQDTNKSPYFFILADETTACVT
ncbi:hypothetical protein NQ314_012296 [Rhamnusium bicolor]|uniref:DUF4371 domain-containing protein n=1 Tax=Rhamnusium bicolor TaxID=1586634 RepID=A0AAV8XC94_9CUCU|nr:hypothetical protein NQ314_012296 [Rhamnusium bicolor]